MHDLIKRSKAINIHELTWLDTHAHKASNKSLYENFDIQT